VISEASIGNLFPTAPLGDVAEFLDSQRRPVTEADRRRGPYPYFGANGQQDSIDDFLFDEPLVLLAEDGGHFDDPNRGIAYRIDGKTWVNNHAHVLRPTDRVDWGYLCRVLENYDVRRYVTGTTRAKLTQGSASEIPIPLPPLAEQRRIADILDRADTLRTKRRGAIARISTLARNMFLQMFGDPFSDPRRWPETTLGAYAEFTGGGTPSRGRPEYFSGSVCWATSKDMTGEFMDDTEEHITDEAIRQSATKLVPADTILVVVKSKVLMHRLPVAISRVPTCFGQDLKGISPDSGYWTVVFVATALRLGQRWLIERARGANTEGLTLEHLRAFPMILPPLTLQNEFGARVRAVADLGTVAERSLAQLDALFASLQHRAFRGEL
jgi:type I restriction enzyme S subunit